MKNFLALTILVVVFTGCKNSAHRPDNQQASTTKKKSVSDTVVLTAEKSDPKNFSWMQGFPPPEDKRLSVADGSFFHFPALRWSVVHMREFFPTINVSRGIGAPQPLEYELDKKIDSLTFYPLKTREKMTFAASLDKNYTDGIIILHKGKVVYEKYFGELTEDQVHAIMSLTKSFTGTLASILVAEGVLDDHAPVTRYVPELSESAYGTATVREVMDMTTAIRFSEDYADPNADIYAFGEAGNPTPKPSDYRGPVGYFEYLKTVKKAGQHGEAFAYKTANTETLGWIISKATGKKVSELLSDRIWRKLGMEQDAYYQIDALGTPFAGGGLNAGLRDLARFGQLILNRGTRNNQQIIPERAVLDIMKGGDPKRFAKAGYTNLKGWSYRDMWWITGNKHGAFMGRGVHGQAIYIDPAAQMVLVRLASHPVAANGANDPYSLPAYDAIAEYLMNR